MTKKEKKKEKKEGKKNIYIAGEFSFFFINARLTLDYSRKSKPNKQRPYSKRYKLRR